MRMKTREYQVWYSDGLGTGGMRVWAVSREEAIKEAERFLPEHEEVKSVEELE